MRTFRDILESSNRPSYDFMIKDPAPEKAPDFYDNLYALAEMFGWKIVSVQRDTHTGRPGAYMETSPGNIVYAGDFHTLPDQPRGKTGAVLGNSPKWKGWGWNLRPETHSQSFHFKPMPGSRCPDEVKGMWEHGDTLRI